MRVWYAVGADQAVVIEVIVRSVIFVKVASIAVDGYTVFIFPMAGLVDKVPDKSTLIFRVLAGDVPVLLESTL